VDVQREGEVDVQREGEVDVVDVKGEGKGVGGDEDDDGVEEPRARLGMRCVQHCAFLSIVCWPSPLTHSPSPSPCNSRVHSK